ncbi:MAG: hypothetical protein ACKO34_03680 [Vampirovibrionales bacterium]
MMLMATTSPPPALSPAMEEEDIQFTRFSSVCHALWQAPFYLLTQPRALFQVWFHACHTHESNVGHAPVGRLWQVSLLVLTVIASTLAGVDTATSATPSLLTWVTQTLGLAVVDVLFVATLALTVSSLFYMTHGHARFSHLLSGLSLAQLPWLGWGMVTLVASVVPALAAVLILVKLALLVWVVMLHVLAIQTTYGLNNQQLAVLLSLPTLLTLTSWILWPSVIASLFRWFA